MVFYDAVVWLNVLSKAIFSLFEKNPTLSSVLAYLQHQLDTSPLLSDVPN